MMPGFTWFNSQPTPAPSARAADRIEQAFDAASRTTGTSFDYLLKTAIRESSLDPNAKASTSSATGLFQFIESTWLETLKVAGAEHGLSAYADAIEMGQDGRYRVSDPNLRQAILDLRQDPEVSSTMAGVLTRRNAGYLSARLGRPVTDGELYIAHFLGARGAASLIGVAAQVPNARASDLFPQQAAANRAIFYENGRPRTVSEVYEVLVAKHQGGTDPLPVAALTDLDAAIADGPEDEPTGGTFAFAAPEASQAWSPQASQTAFSGLFAGRSAPAASAPAEAPMPIVPLPADRPPSFQVFAMAPALFDVAAAEDTRGFIEDEKARAAVPLPPTPPGTAEASPSLAHALAGQQRRGPLDLSAFMRPTPDG